MKIKKTNNKRAVFFSTDALIAMIIIFLTVLVAYPAVKYAKQESVLQEDILRVLSSITIGEINNSYVQDYLIPENKVTNLNKTVLEQIGEFYVTNKTLARDLAEAVLSPIDPRENIGIWFGGTLIASRNVTPLETAENIEVAFQNIGGIRGESNGSVTGFSASAYLTSSTPKKYFYFGGYVGDGNVSVLVEYNGTLTNTDLEIVASTNFTICVNGGGCAGFFEPFSSAFEPKNFSSIGLPLQSGKNIVKFVPINPYERLYIAGGFFKITYNDSGYRDTRSRYYFPGIEGIINLYDGFYVPGDLNGMTINVVFNSNATAFLIIGNKTIFNQSTSGTETITKTNAEILSVLGDYEEYERKTIPLRLGLENVSFIPVNNAYIVSVADLSGAISSAKSDCDGDGIAESSGDRAVGCANVRLIEMLLSVNITQIGLVGTRDTVIPEYSHELSRDQESLNNTIENWTQGGNLDLCAGIQNATATLNAAAVGSDFKSIVLLGTKYPNSCFSTTNNAQIYTDTYNLACDAWNTYGIRIDTVGIIGGGDQQLNSLLADIATCAGGKYYNQTAGEDLLDLYQDLGNELLSVIYYMQTAGAGAGFYSYLSPESYIEFDYTPDELPGGLVTTLEKKFYSDYYGNFSVPSGTELIEAKTVSYSGPRWTDNTEINGISIYDLSVYGPDYLKLGDPYVVHLPNSFIQPDGVVNTVRLTTGYSPGNSTYGSEFNKIIYTVKQNVSSFSEVVARAEGCIWQIEFENGDIITTPVPGGYSAYPPEYCFYNSTEQVCGSGRDCTDGDHPDADAIQIAVYELLQLMDFDDDGRIDVLFTEQDLQMSSSEFSGIPFTFSTEVQIRKWY